MGDAIAYRVWMRTLAREGLSAAYWPARAADPRTVVYPVDYPPALPYVYWGIGHALKAVSPQALDSDRLLDFVIRLLSCACNLLLAALVYLETRRQSPGHAEGALAFVALNPALLFDTAYWGQADAPCVLLVVASLMLLVRRRPEWAFVAMLGAALVKPLAYPMALPLAAETLRRFSLSRTLRSAGAAACAGLLALVPFVAVGRLSDGIKRFLSQVDEMPYLSVNAHNVWWLLGRGTPWTSAVSGPTEFLSWKGISLLAFAAFAALVLSRLLRSREPSSVFVAAASCSFGFFVLCTHMHENHAISALPLLALSGVGAKPVRRALGVLTFAILANMVLHDPFMTSVLRPHVPGPHLRLPPVLEPQTAIEERYAALGYPWMAEEMRGETSLLGFVATGINAEVIVFVFAVWLLELVRNRALEPLVAEDRPRFLPLPFRAAALVFFVAASAAILHHALSFPGEHRILLSFSGADVVAAEPERVGVLNFQVGGKSRTVLGLRPPSKVRYTLDLPQGTELLTGIAVQQECWTKDGKGVLFEVKVEEGGSERVVFSARLDPGQIPSDRGFRDERIDLGPFRGQRVLVFETSGDVPFGTPFDCAGFSDPTLVSR